MDSGLKQLQMPLQSENLTNAVTLSLSSLMDTGLKWEFSSVPLTSRDKNEWYGPWDTILHRLFRSKDGFQISPQRVLLDRKGGSEWTLFYFVRFKAHVIGCIIYIQPYYHYEYASYRIQAYEELEASLKAAIRDDLVDQIPMVYGIQCMGPRFMVMSMDNKVGQALPALRQDLRGVNMAEVAPKKWWHLRADKKGGCERLIQLVEEVKASLQNFDPIDQSSLEELSEGSSVEESDMEPEP